MRLFANDMIRRGEDRASIASAVILHSQDYLGEGGGRGGTYWNEVVSVLVIARQGDLEIIEFGSGADEEWSVVRDDIWNAVYKTNEAFFVVGYGATRRVERPENFDMGARMRVRFGRAQRVQSLFDDSYSLIPLTYWLPELKHTNRGHYNQVVDLLNTLLRPARYTFTGEIDKGDYLFERGGDHVPFLSMSDGYRAFIGWAADLLYHVSSGCPSGSALDQTRGIVMVDEIDLHLHPRWQMRVIETVARALPRMQFLFTSHSPLVASSLEWMNIITLKLAPKANRTIVKRLRESIHGLDADQVLLTDFFGLKTTRAPGKVSQLEELRRKARHGDQDAARKLILAMSRGTEEAE